MSYEAEPNREEVDRLSYNPMHDHRTVDVDAWAKQWFGEFADLNPEDEDDRDLMKLVPGALYLRPDDRQSDAEDLGFGMLVLSLIGQQNPHDAAARPYEYREWEHTYELARLIGRQIVRVTLDYAERYAAFRVEQERSGTDYLTGLANRLGLFRQLEERYGINENPVRHGPSGEPLPPIKLMHVYGDINQFRWINNNLGHHVGDAAIVEGAWRTQDIFRRSEAPILYRHGGDEFGAIVGDLSDDEMEQIAERLMALQVARVTGAPYKEGIHAIEERLEEVRASGQRVRAEARQSELTVADIAAGKRPHYMLYINGTPVTKLANIVSFAVGIATAFVSTQSDIEDSRRSAEQDMEGSKDMLHGIMEGTVEPPPSAT